VERECGRVASQPPPGLRELLGLSKVALILGCFAGSRPSGTNQGVMTVTSSTLLNLIVSIVAVGVLDFVLRAAYLVAGGRPYKTQC
jgi:ABC-type transporter Mla maintaining outer membrane lipid asymmetry permease subunit MlaE